MTRKLRRRACVLHSRRVCGLEVTMRCDRLSAISSFGDRLHTEGVAAAPDGRDVDERATQSRWVRDLGAVRNLWHSGIVKFVKSVRIGAFGRTRAPAPHNDRNGRSHARDAAECRADLAAPECPCQTTRDRPRTRRGRAAPRTLPFGHAFGSAGRRCISPAWLWRSISIMPAVTPKLPSIWNGGCASKRLAYTPPPPR